MENLLFFLATSFAIRKLSAPRKFRNYFIGDTGCSALTYGDDVEKIRTRNGGDLYFHQFSEKNVKYGMICIRLQEDYELCQSAELLSVYMNKLRKPFLAKYNIGISEDADWNQTGTIALTDYWQDKNGQDWKVKGYTNGNFMAVLYVKNIAQAESNKHDLFLDSFHFG